MDFTAFFATTGASSYMRLPEKTGIKFRHLPWIRKWREHRHRQRLQEAEQREQRHRQRLQEAEQREAEQRLQREAIQRQIKDHEQARALRLTLLELQRTMDPLVATQTYNNRFCPLTRMPEELLVLLLDFLNGDVVTLNCLRMASRIFLRLIKCDSILHAAFMSMRPCPTLPFRRILQRDGRCENCKRWNDSHESRRSELCRFWVNTGYRPQNWPRCNICNSYHDASQSCLYRCLAQQGSIQLCQHVQIVWASIEAHIDAWKRRQQGEGTAGDWQACLDSFRIECQDASHDTRCTLSEAPTWPQAYLCTARWHPKHVVLRLKWAPHARVAALSPTADGRIPAPELRALFRRLRQLGPADMLYPLSNPDSLPEMACFRSTFPIYYDTGDIGSKDEEMHTNETPSPPPPASNPLRCWELSQHCQPSSLSWHGIEYRSLNIKPHHLRGVGNTGIAQQCLVINYIKEILICSQNDLKNPAVKILPTGPWIHAMDPDTYIHHQSSQLTEFRPICRDEACTNYYRRGKDYCHC